MKDFTPCFGGRRTFLKWERRLGVGGLKEPSSPWVAGEHPSGLPTA